MISSLAKLLFGQRRAEPPVLQMEAPRVELPTPPTAPVSVPVPAAPPTVQVPEKPGFPTNPYVAQQHLLRGLGVTAPVVFDVGAHKGQTAKTYRSLLPDASIYCFEPFPDTAEVLEQNLAGDPAIKVVRKAVSDKSGRRTFFVNERDATNSLLPRPSSARRYYPQFAGPKTTTDVETITLDEFVASERIPDVTVLKFDIQGGELMALKGATDLLSRGSVLMIYTEMMFIPHYEGAPLLHELWGFLARFGYQLFDIYDLHRATNGQLRYGDALFVNESVRKNCLDRSPEEP